MKFVAKCALGFILASTITGGVNGLRVSATMVALGATSATAVAVAGGITRR